MTVYFAVSFSRLDFSRHIFLFPCLEYFPSPGIDISRKKVRPQLRFEDRMNLCVSKGENGNDCREKAADREKWK